MSKQTAVNWLEQEFIALQNYGVNELGLFLKAKEMEKQQIENAFENGMDAANIYNLEQYYNETFNK